MCVFVGMVEPRNPYIGSCVDWDLYLRIGQSGLVYHTSDSSKL